MKQESIFDDTTDHLMDVIKSLKNRKDLYNFFKDLCTIKEIKEMSKRLEAATMLHEGANYETIQKKMKISSATLSRINKCLQYGDGGYRSVLNNKLKKEEENEKF